MDNATFSRRWQIIVCMLLLSSASLFSQDNIIYKKGITADENLKAIGSLKPYSSGGMGFDTRYEGVKGSPRLFDSLLTSFLKIKGQSDYLEIKADIDQVNNVLLISHPKTGQLLALPADMVTELVVLKDSAELLYRTTAAINLDKNMKGYRFFEVLAENPRLFIKLPVKTFTEADYKGAYTSDRRYDEYGIIYRYYIIGDDKKFNRIQLNRKALVKLYPAMKDQIERLADEAKSAGLSDEDEVKFILEGLK